MFSTVICCNLSFFDVLMKVHPFAHVTVRDTDKPVRSMELFRLIGRKYIIYGVNKPLNS